MNGSLGKTHNGTVVIVRTLTKIWKKRLKFEVYPWTVCENTKKKYDKLDIGWTFQILTILFLICDRLGTCLETNQVKLSTRRKRGRRKEAEKLKSAELTRQNLQEMLGTSFFLLFFFLNNLLPKTTRLFSVKCP